MSKIATYPSADTPLQLSDRLIGTEAVRPIPSKTPLATKNFSLGELLQLFSSEFPAATLQAVLNAGNIATQDITLIGTITSSLIIPTNIQDMLGSQGTTFQYLSKAVGGFNWVDLPVDGLQAVLDKSNTATQNIILTGDITANKIILGNIQDDNGSIGTYGQVLTKGGHGIVWGTGGGGSQNIQQVLDIGNTAVDQGILLTSTDPVYHDGFFNSDRIEFYSLVGEEKTSGLSAFGVQFGSNAEFALSINEDGITIGNADSSLQTKLYYNNPTGLGTILIPDVVNDTKTLATTDDIGSWGALNYPTWTTGTPFVKMTAAGTFALDTNTYLTGITSSDITTALGYTPVTNARTLTINGVGYDLTADRSWTIATGSGTVTSVGTTGLISGGTITSSGTITTSMTTNKLVGRYSTGTGIMEEITIGSGLTLTAGGILNNTATPTGTGYYGAFQDMLTQTLAVANTGQPFLIRTLDEANQVSITANGSGQLTRITPANTGVYNIQWSGQFQNPDNAIHDVNIWFRKGLVSSSGPGTDVVGSNGLIAMPARKSAAAGEQGHVVAGWNFVLTIAAGEYVEFYWMSDSTQVTLQAYAAGSPPPSTASLIVTVTQQAGILAGTGITAINSLTGAAQTLTVGTTGTDFAIVDSGIDHKFNLPTASATNRGALSTTDWTAFNNKQDAIVILNDTRTTSAVTGTTSLTILNSYLAPANTFASNDRLQFDYLGLKSTAVATGTYRIYINTTNSLSGATQIATFANATGSKFQLMQRNAAFKSATTLEIMLTTTGNAYDLGTDGTLPSTITYNTAVAYYIITAVLPTSASDSYTQSRFAITRYKSKNTI